MNIKDFFIKALPNAQQSVRFYLYEDKHWDGTGHINFPELIPDGGEVADFIINTNSACFAGLKGQMKKEGKDCNRLILLAKPTDAFTIEERLWWFRQAVKYELLPEYIDPQEVVDKEALVLDIRAHNLNQLYVYLTMIRLLREKPTFVKNATVLTKKYKVDFYAALVAAIYIGPHVASNHHFIPDVCGYMQGIQKGEQKEVSISIDVTTMIGLYQAVKNKFIGKANIGNGFSVSPNIRGYTNDKQYALPLNKLGHPMVAQAIRAGNMIASRKAILRARISMEEEVWK